MWVEELLYRMRMRAERVRGFRERFFLKELPKKGVILLPGIRGVGKSVALLQLFLKDGGYLFWVDETSLFYGKGLKDVIREAERREGALMEELKVQILLDEVHYDPLWAQTLKWLADVFRGRVVATGSSAIAFQMTPELGRRAKVIWVWPLSFYEWLHLRGEEVKPVRLEDLFRKKVAPEYRPGFHRFLREGGLPVTFELGLDAVTRAVERIIFNDMLLAGFDRRTIAATPQLLMRLAVSPSLSVERLASEVGLSKPTVISVLNYLERSGLIIQLRPYGPLSSVRKGLKRYFISPTIRYALTRPSYDEGLLLEEYVTSQLYLMALRNGWELTFWPGEGPDLVLIMGGKRVAVEVGIGKKDLRQVSRALVKVDEAVIISERGSEGKRIKWIPIESFYRAC